MIPSRLVYFFWFQATVLKILAWSIPMPPIPVDDYGLRCAIISTAILVAQWAARSIWTSFKKWRTA